MVRWNKATAQISLLADVAAKRALKIAHDSRAETKLSMMAVVMDLTAVAIEEQVCLNTLCSFSDGDFGHDVFGIMRFIDRDTGKLTQGFFPRCGKSL